MNKSIALVTGCTSGIGLHLAREFASRGHDLILVAPEEQELEELAIELGATRGTRCHLIARDLEQESAADEIYEFIREKGLEVDILANNAGHGYRGKFWANDIGRDLSMVNLNICAVLRLTKLILPLMLTRGSGSILNTASIPGCDQGPLLAVYQATRAFVISWSEALAAEVADSGVTITALCTGPTASTSPQEVARAGYEGLMRGDLFVLPGPHEKSPTAFRAPLGRKPALRVPAAV